MHFFICVLSTISYFYIITRIKQISFQFLKIIIQECFEVVPRHESVFTNPLQLVQVAWKACTPILSCFCGGVQSRVFCYMPTLPAYCHSVVYISYICHFDMANANIRRHFREAELLRAVGMVQQGATYRQVGAALGVHHTVITRAGERYRLQGTPARRHAGGRQRVTTPAQDSVFGRSSTSCKVFDSNFSPK